MAEAMGANVIWNDATRTITIQQGVRTLSIVVDTPLPGGMGSPLIVSDRTFVPIRYVAETLGAAVRWDEAARAVYITQ